MGRVSRYKKVKLPCGWGRGGSVGNGRRVECGTSDFALFGVGGADRMRRRKLEKKERKAERYRNKKKGRKNCDESERFGWYDCPPTDGDDFHISAMTNVRPEPVDVVAEAKFMEEGQSAERDGVGANSILDATSSGSGDTSCAKCIIPQTEEDEERVARILRIEESVKNNGSGNKGGNERTTFIEGRMEGESMKAFQKRVRKETRVIIQQTEGGGSGLAALKRRNPDRHEKKAQYLKKKKQKRNRNSASFCINYKSPGDFVEDGDDSSGTLITGERAVAVTALGLTTDQAARPPVFHVLPRGAKTKQVTLGQERDFTLTSIDLQDEVQRQDAERRAKERMREKVQAQYALVKASRKKAGDFHL